MNFKRILVLVMTFAMLISTFMPALNVFAAEINEGASTQQKPEKNYVSIGDSMANGYGFEGYEQGQTNSESHMTLDKFMNGEGVYGEGAYPDQFAEYLSRYYTVNHTKLAVSALRAEDLLYLLGGRDEPADDWFDEVVYYATGAKDYSVVDELAAYYQNAVKNADVITLGVGNASFGAFLLSRATSMLGVMGGSLDAEQYEMYTLANALELVEGEEAKATVVEIYNEALEYLNAYVPAEVAEEYNLTSLCELLAYVSAGYIINYSKSIDKIVELNESENLEIILVGLMNTTYGMTIKVNDELSIDFGGIMDKVFEALNAYMAAYPTVKYAKDNAIAAKDHFVNNYTGEVKETLDLVDGMVDDWTFVEGKNVPTFYYAAQPNPDFIVNALDDLANAGWTNVDCEDENCGVEGHVCENGRLSAYIVRSRTITTYNDNIREMLTGLVGTTLPTINVDDVKAFESFVLPEGYPEEAAFMIFDTTPENTADDMLSVLKVTSIAIYLALEDAIIESLTVENIPLEGLQKISNIQSIFSSGVAVDASSPYQIRETLGEFFSSDDVLPLVYIFAIFKIGDGMCVHPTPTGHDNLTNEIINAYETKWTAEKQTIKNVYETVVEYYDEAYEYGYQYADENGYIDLSVNAIDEAIKAIYVAIDEVNAGLLGVTDELKSEIVKELYATIETLKELREVLATDSAKDVEGLVAAVLALEDDLYTHLNNIYAVLAQAGIDVNQLVILPALKEALYILETVVIPAVLEAAEAFANAVVEYLKAKVDEAYQEIVAILVRIQLHVQEKLTNAIAPILNAYFTVVETLTKVYGTVQEAIRVANQIFNQLVILNEKLNGALTDAFDKVAELFVTLYEAYGNVEDALLALNNILMNVVSTTKEAIENVIAAYNALVAKLYEIYGTIEAAVEKAYEIYNNIVATVNGAVAKGIEIYNAILEILANTYGTIENIVTVASQIFARIYEFVGEDLKGMFDEIVAIVKATYGATQDAYYTASQIYAYLVNALEATFEGHYVVTNDSKYVSLGNAVYGEELAEMLQLADKYSNFALTEDYLDAVASADLITVRFDNGEAIAFVMSQLNNPTELDWSKYLDEEGQAALENVLADVKADILANGQAETISNTVSELVALPGVELTSEVIAEVVAYTMECTLYSYAEFVDRLTVTLENVYAAAPEALVVLTGIQNPLDELDLSELGLNVELGEYAKALGYVVKALNLQLMAMAFVDDNTVYVGSNDAADIYDALNVEFNLVEVPVCEHEYDDCEDTTCNKCGAERTAPGHSFTNYVYNEDATCGVNGTETAKCDNCDAEDTREAAGTALEHKYGEWVVVKEATTEETGLKERTCEHCGHKETEVIPMILPEPTTDAPEKKNNTAYWVIAVVVALLAVCIFVKKPAAKKEEVKKENNETSENETSEEK